MSIKAGAFGINRECVMKIIKSVFMICVLFCSLQAWSQEFPADLHSSPICERVLKHLEGALGKYNGNVPGNHLEAGAEFLWNEAPDVEQFNTCLVELLGAYSRSPNVAEKRALLLFLTALSIYYQEDVESREKPLVIATGDRFTQYLNSIALPWMLTEAIMAILRARQAVPRMMNEASQRFIPYIISRLFYSPGTRAAIFIGTPLGVAGVETGWERIDTLINGEKLNPNTLYNHTLALEAYNLGVSACNLKYDLENEALFPTQEFPPQDDPIYEQEPELFDQKQRFCDTIDHSNQLLPMYLMVRELSPKYRHTTEGGYLTPQMIEDIESESEKELELRDFLMQEVQARYPECGQDENNRSEINLNYTQRLLIEGLGILEEHPSFGERAELCNSRNRNRTSNR